MPRIGSIPSAPRSAAKKSFPSRKVLLLANGVGLGEQAAQFIRDVSGCGQPEMMNVVSCREALDAADARRVDDAREDDVPVDPPRSWRELREGHPDLECNPALLRHDAHAARLTQGGEEVAIDCTNVRRLACEVRRQRVPPARMRLIPVGETAAALRARPHWPRTATGPSRHRNESPRSEAAVSTRPSGVVLASRPAREVFYVRAAPQVRPAVPRLGTRR